MMRDTVASCGWLIDTRQGLSCVKDSSRAAPGPVLFRVVGAGFPGKKAASEITYYRG